MAAPIKSKAVSVWRKKEIDGIKDKVKAFLKDRKQANNVLEIIATLDTDDEAIAVTCVYSLCRIFVLLVNKREMQLVRLPTDEDSIERTAEEKYKLWLRERHADAFAKLVNCLASKKKKLQETALVCLMRLVQANANFPLVKVPSGQYYFPVAQFETIVFCLLSNTMDMRAVIVRIEEFTRHQDIKFYTLKATNKRFNALPNLEKNEIFLNNCFALMERTLILSKETTEHVHTYCYAKVKDTEECKFCSSKLKSAFTSVWLSFLKAKLSGSLYRRVLVILHDKVLPHLHYPLFLTDFYMEAYNLGGAASLLALNGIFVLMQKHNLEFPDFFKRLYALFEPALFHTRYLARFFYLTDIFFTSTHLPEYVVAAFVKKLSRLSLTAPPQCLRFVLPFIRNLICRHPGLFQMLHRPAGPSELSSDPYDDNEKDLAKCRALESSLWEIKTLTKHYCPSTSKVASFVDKKLPQIESDILPLLDLGVDDMIKSTVKRQKKNLALNYTKPQGICNNEGDKLKDFWTF